MAHNRVDGLKLMQSRCVARARRKQENKAKRKGKNDYFTLARKERQRADERIRRLNALICVDDILPKPPKQLTLEATEEAESRYKQAMCQYRHRLKKFFAAIECADEPTMPPPLTDHADNYVKELHQHAVGIYDHRLMLAREVKDARESFAKRPLQEPQLPKYDPNIDSVFRTNKGCMRYIAKYALWAKKMRERGYDV